MKVSSAFGCFGSAVRYKILELDTVQDVLYSVIFGRFDTLTTHDNGNSSLVP